MSVYLATKTMDAINAAIEKDQGAKFREFLGRVMPYMKDAFEPEEQHFRSHLGASMLGRECGRDIWYGFRWAVKSKFPGRMVRLFNRGHLEEARFIAMLLMIGCQVYQQDAEGKQYRISFAEGHAGGSGDGFAIGVPDLDPNTPCLTEFKTHNDKSFKKLKEEGVRSAKFEHYVQMNLYMKKFGIGVALYGAVNKNDDEVYFELIPYDDRIATDFLQRGEQLVWMLSPPPKLGASIGFWKCKMCNNKGVCHMGDAPAMNCRTCEFSAPMKNAEWHCTNPVCAGVLSKEQQLQGCSWYEKKKAF